jgi:hypothetical protein
MLPVRGRVHDSDYSMIVGCSIVDVVFRWSFYFQGLFIMSHAPCLCTHMCLYACRVCIAVFVWNMCVTCTCMYICMMCM